MISADKPRLVAILLKLQSVFPRDLNEHTYGAYFEALKDWKIQYIERAAREFVRSATFFPLPKDFKLLLVEYAWTDELWKDMHEAVPTLPNEIKEKVNAISSKTTNLSKLSKANE